MPEILQTQCPHCKSSMKLKSRKALGKQAPCPKCKKPFLVKELPAETVDDYEDAGLTDEYDTGDTSVDDEYDGYEDDDEPRRRPQRSKRNSGGKKRRRKKAGGKWVKPTLLIGGGVSGVVLVGLGIWLIWGMFSKTLELAWLPPDANSISIERPSATWSTGVAARYTSAQADELLEKERKYWGVTQRDIESITTGRNSSGENIRVIRSSASLDPETILKNVPKHEKAEHEGETYYRVGGNALYFPDSKTAVSGSEESVKKAIERGPTPPERDEFDFVDASYDSVTVTTGSSMSFFMSIGIQGRVEVSVDSSSSGGSTSKKNFQAKFSSVDAAITATEKAQKSLQEAKEKWKSTMETARNAMKQTGRFGRATLEITEEEIEDALRCMESSMNSMSISRSGQVVTMTAKLYKPKFEKRKEEDRRSKRTNFSASSEARSWGRRTFDIPLRATWN